LVEGGRNSLTGVEDSLKGFIAYWLVFWVPFRAEILMIALLLRASLRFPE
jgi:hypothetical protein